MGKRVLSVGQCGADQAALSAFLEERFDADVETAATADEAMSSLHNGPFDLVLVNRVLDDDGESGLELIRSIKKHSGISHVPILLISNHADAQEQAVQLGAVHGFGKARLGAPETIDCLEPLLSNPLD